MMAIVLHRCPTPTDRLCPCGRVARELKRAGLPFETVREPLRKRDRDRIQALTGQPKVPVLVLENGEAIADSRRIVEHLEARSA